METIPLQKKLYVKSTECGSIYLNSNGSINDINTCFWNCLHYFLKNKLGKNVNLLTLKYLTTFDLPFQHLLLGVQDPSKKNGLADHRVIQKTVDLFQINICLLTSGTHIYNFKYGKEKDTMCLFLHKNHFKLVDDQVYEKRMISVAENPNLVLNFFPEKTSKSRRKRGIKKKGKTYKTVLNNDGKPSIFDVNLEEAPTAKALFENQKRKRGKRGKRKN